MSAGSGPTGAAAGVAFDGAVALVTGAGRGLGAAIARRLADAGARVVVSDIDLDRAESLADDLPGGALAVTLDVTDPASVESAVDEIRERAEEPSVLINNAGIARVGPSERVEWEDWAVVLDTNLNGVFRVTQAVAPGMLRHGAGAIVNIGSANSVFGSPGRAAYSAAKTGVVGLTRALAVEWAARGIRVNAVLPGYIDTRLLRAGFDRGVIEEEYLVGRIPAAQLGSAAQVGSVVTFLASPAAAYVTGQALAVDGGFTVNGAPHPIAAQPDRAEVL